MRASHEPVRVIVCGSRRWTDRKTIEHALYDLVIEFGSNLTIVHGCAEGADRIAEQETMKAGLLIERHPADWASHGKAAGPIRNREMAAAGAAVCVAFWDGTSNGTRDMMYAALNAGIAVVPVSARSEVKP